MCGIGLTNRQGLLDTNKFCQRRGPDYTNLKIVNGYEILHNLLHLTGEKTIQPICDDDVACVFNGEIYNYKSLGDYKSDGYAIIDLYKKEGIDFVKKLDGEYAILILDKRHNYLIMVTDSFATKPLWFSFEGKDFASASYESQIKELGFKDVTKMTANTAIQIDLNRMEIMHSFPVYVFELVQYKNTYDDWIKAFERSIKKRAWKTQYPIFMGLSSGYDSGAIACELSKQGIDNFKTYTICGPENMDVVRSRVDKIKSHQLIDLTQNEYDIVKDEIITYCENFRYKDKYIDYDIKDDKASVGLAAICRRANKESRRIYLSGQGADEIISDYGYNGHKIYNHSSFGGKFPDNLGGFFPWHSFWDGTQIQYLNKEEYVAGCYGIETRYPFLDVELVQEFLWLTAELKNRNYKAPLHEYFVRNNFPFAQEKIGFNVKKNLR